MSYQPEDNNLRDIIDILSEGAQDWHEYVDENGDIQRKLEIDPEKLYWSTRIVNSPFFGRFILILKRLEQKAHECKNNMSLPRAINMSTDIIAMVKGYKYSVDGKASESIRDKNNTQGTLLHLIRKQSIEREYIAKNEKSKALLGGLLGNNKEEE